MAAPCPYRNVRYLELALTFQPLTFPEYEAILCKETSFVVRLEQPDTVPLFIGRSWPRRKERDKINLNFITLFRRSGAQRSAPPASRHSGASIPLSWLYLSPQSSFVR